MIRALSALTRQVQVLFQQHLVGIYSWEQIEFAPRETVRKPPPSEWPVNDRGRRRRPDMPEGKFEQQLRMKFGLWDLEVEGPIKHPPLGWIRLAGADNVEGPLDSETWKAVALKIKQYHEEVLNVG